MSDNNRSEFFANAVLGTSAPRKAQASNWTLPSRCKRPPLKPTPRPPLFARLLSLLGFK